ncbi:hypothetical protein E8N14_10190 [Salmonella enterica subsp. enterica serovar Newport]|nr:hypothetical protein E8N14_10190 [Salmonella enterica subsp. enterica serovar Newport]
MRAFFPHFPLQRRAYFQEKSKSTSERSRTLTGTDPVASRQHMRCHTFATELLARLIIHVKNIYLSCKKIADKVNLTSDFLV